jgi:hypothetical protein
LVDAPPVTAAPRHTPSWSFARPATPLNLWASIRDLASDMVKLLRPLAGMAGPALAGAVVYAIANVQHLDDRDRADGHLPETLSDANRATDYAQTYRIVMPDGEIRWIAARGEIMRDETGRAVILRGTTWMSSPCGT